MAVRKVDQMGVGGVCEIQMPLGFQLAVKAVRGPHCIRSTESILDRLWRYVNPKRWIAPVLGGHLPPPPPPQVGVLC